MISTCFKFRLSKSATNNSSKRSSSTTNVTFNKEKVATEKLDKTENKLQLVTVRVMKT